MSHLNSHVAEPFRSILNVWAVTSDGNLLGAWADAYTAKWEAARYEEEHKTECQVQPAQIQVGYEPPFDCDCCFGREEGHPEHTNPCRGLPVKKYQLSWGNFHLCEECAKHLKEAHP